MSIIEETEKRLIRVSTRYHNCEICKTKMKEVGFRYIDERPVCILWSCPKCGNQFNSLSNEWDYNLEDNTIIK